MFICFFTLKFDHFSHRRSIQSPNIEKQKGCGILKHTHIYQYTHTYTHFKFTESKEKNENIDIGKGNCM